MNREQEILSRAMNYVDDDMIVAAHAPHKKLRHRMPALMAACLAVVVVATFPVWRTTVKGNEKGDAPLAPGETNAMENENSGGNHFEAGTSLKPETPMPGIGIPVSLGGTTVTMTAVSKTTATLRVVKTDDTPLHAMIFQYAAGVLGSTEPDFRDGETILRPYTIRLYIDGATEASYVFPTLPGTYEVVVDFSLHRNGNYRIEDYLGLYIRTSDGQILMRHVDLTVAPDTAVPTETGAETEPAMSEVP